MNAFRKPVAEILEQDERSTKVGEILGMPRNPQVARTVDNL